MAAPMVMAIDALEATLQEAVTNSKIANTLDREISKALGLLVDLILLPFLPLLVGGIIQLYMAVIDFGKWWNNVTGVLKEEGLLGLIKLSINVGTEWAEEWVGNLIKMLFGTDKEKVDAAKKTFDALVNFLKPIFGIPILEPILNFLFDKATNPKDILATVIAGIEYNAEIVSKVVGFIFDVGVAITNSVFNFTVNLIKDGLKIIWDVVNFVFDGKGFANNTIDLAVSLSKKNPTDTAWQALGAVASVSPFGAVFSMISALTGRASGGPVSAGTPYMVGEKGPEMFIPSSNGNIAANGSGGNTFHFYGLTNDDLPEKVRSILRQEGTRYTL